MDLACNRPRYYHSDMAAPQQGQTVAHLDEGLPPQLEAIARRVAWWKTPHEAVANMDDFLCRVMTFGHWNDATYVVKKFGEDAMRHALSRAPAGVFDAPSWNYWHHRLGFSAVPALPKREFR
jgi:hypothetical protein